MHVVVTIVVLVWAAFWIFWLASAAGVKSGRHRWGNVLPVRLAVVLVVVLLVRLRVFKGETVTDDPWLQGIGLAVFAAGLAVAVWARRSLGANWGTPMSEKADPELVTTGPYRRVRHPIYSGIILAMVGTAVAISWHWLAVTVVAGGYFVYSAFVEERYMAAQFPVAFPAYRRSTKMLIPFVF